MLKITTSKVICLTLISASFQVSAEDWGLCHNWPKPTLDYPRSERGEDAPIVLNADSSESQNNEVVKLFGNVLVQRPDEQLRADETIYNKASQTLDASGNVRYETPDFSTYSSEAQILSGNNQGSFTNAEFFIYERHARGASSNIQLAGEDLTIMKQTLYTTCDKDDEVWSLRASTVELNHASGMGDTYNTRLYIQGVPIFYLPYMRFPISDQRLTGLLAPSWGSTSAGGNEFAQPIYINLHPQLDATITPRSFSERGLQLGNELRYLNRFGEGVISGERIDDKIYGQTRSLFHYEHQGQLGNNWSGDILFDRISDDDYFNDFSNSLSGSATQTLEQRVQLQYADSTQQMQIQVQDFQVIGTSQPYRRLPQIKHQLNPAMSGPFKFAMESELVRFQRLNRLGGKRAYVKPALSLPYQRNAGFIIPKLSLHYSQYRLDADNNSLAVENLTRSVPINSVDGGIFLEKDTRIGQTDYLQTLEPRLFYLYIPYRDQTDVPLFDTSALGFDQSRLFSENRFSGPDRIGDTNQITLSLSSRLIRTKDGREQLYGSIGKIFYFDDRRVGLTGNELNTERQSDMLAETQFKPTDRLSLRARLLWNTSDKLITERDIRLQYQAGNNRILNLSYRDRGNRLSAPATVSREIDTSLLWPLTPRWSMMARRYHSLSDNRTMEQMAGFEYNSCCWTMRAVRRANFVADTSVLSAPFGNLRYSWYVQFELKGLTSLGKRIDALMEEQIFGFNAVK